MAALVFEQEKHVKGRVMEKQDIHDALITPSSRQKRSRIRWSRKFVGINLSGVTLMPEARALA